MALIQEPDGVYSGKYPIKFCPLCGAQRPEERDELDEIMDKWWPLEFGTHKQLIKKDLRAWKEKDHIVDANKMVGEEEKQKKLWRIIASVQDKDFDIQAEAVIEAVERVIDKYILTSEEIHPKTAEGIRNLLRSEL